MTSTARGKNAERGARPNMRRVGLGLPGEFDERSTPRHISICIESRLTQSCTSSTHIREVNRTFCAMMASTATSRNVVDKEEVDSAGTARDTPNGEQGRSDGYHQDATLTQDKKDEDKKAKKPSKLKSTSAMTQYLLFSG